LQAGDLTPIEHDEAVRYFAMFMRLVAPPPDGESGLILRAEAIRRGYSCRRSADGIYVALAELLAAGRPTVLLTFDKEMARQANRVSPAVEAHVVAA
jgi:predicted nucleic acid-binding protein